MAGTEKNRPVLGLRHPRYVRGYPKKVHSQIRRLKLGAVTREALRAERPRMHARSRGTKYDTEEYLEQRAQPGISGSLYERIFYKALIQRGLMPGVDFDFQASELGGRSEFGGLVADFIFLLPMVVVQVQSYWHNISLEIETRDETQQALLENLGYTVFYLWPETLLDEAAFEYWMDRNIDHLWGTSSGRFGGVSQFIPPLPSSVPYLAPKYGGMTVAEYEDLLRRIENLSNQVSSANASQRLSYLEAAMTGVQGAGDVRITSGMLATQIQSSDYVANTSGWKITRDGSAEFQNITARGTIYASSGIIEGVLTIGLGGGFFQGTGTFGSPDTALKIYRDTSTGVGLLEMWGSGTKQVYFDTDGKLYAGGGDVKLDSTGIFLKQGNASTNYIRWLDVSSNVVGYTYASIYSPDATIEHTASLRAKAPSSNIGTEAGSSVTIAALRNNSNFDAIIEVNSLGAGAGYTPRINFFVSPDGSASYEHTARFSGSGAHFFSGASVGYTPSTQPSVTSTLLKVNGPGAFEGVVSGSDPTDLTHFVTLSYLQNAVPSLLTYYIHATNIMSSTLVESETSSTESVDVTPKDTIAICYKTSVVDTPTPFTINAGSILQLHIAARVTASGKKPTTLSFRLYYVDSDGTSNKTVISSESDETDILTTTKTEYEVHMHAATAVTVPAGKRLWLEIYANTTGASPFPDLQIYQDSVLYHLSIPVQGNIVNNFVQKSGDTMTGDLTGTNVNLSGSLVLSTDVSISRGAANRLDLATGDSLNIVSGALQIAGTSAIDSSRNFSGATSLTLGGDAVLSRGAANRFDIASGDSLNLVSGSLQIAGTSAIDSSRNFSAATSLTLGGDVVLSDGGSNQLNLDSGDSMKIVSGALGINADPISYIPLNVDNEATNQSSTRGMSCSSVHNTTTTGTYYGSGLTMSAYERVSATKTNSGYMYALNISAWRNANGAAVDDSGTLANLAGAIIRAGHYNTDDKETPVSTTVEGIHISTYNSTGTITNLYQLFLQAHSGTAPVTANYGVYQEGSNQGNYFAGKVGIGVAPGTPKLKVSGSVGVGGDDGGTASYVTLTNATSSISTGTGTVKMGGSTSRNSTGWLKFYSGTTAYYLPFWQTITG
jgi:very-short-patch-repair endonuclease